MKEVSLVETEQSSQFITKYDVLFDTKKKKIDTAVRMRKEEESCLLEENAARMPFHLKELLR